MNVIAKYTRSLSSSNLRDNENNYAIEPIMAVAMADTSGIGSLLWRAKYHNDGSVYARLLAQWQDIIVKKSEKENWPVKNQAKLIAKISLQHWIDDVCRLCNGTSFAPHPGNDQVLSDKPCTCCNGTAKRPLSGFKNQIEHIGNCVAMLETEERILGSLAVKKLHDVDFNF